MPTKSKFPEYGCKNKVSFTLTVSIAKRSTGTETSIPLTGIDLSAFTSADIATVAKNYGEILSGLWSMSNLEFERIYFPKMSNAAMIDFYGERNKMENRVRTSLTFPGFGILTFEHLD